MDGAGTKGGDMRLIKQGRRWHLYRNGREVYAGTLDGAFIMIEAIREVGV